jgi:hypothetical protein
MIATNKIRALVEDDYIQLKSSEVTISEHNLQSKDELPNANPCFTGEVGNTTIKQRAKILIRREKTMLATCSSTHLPAR